MLRFLLLFISFSAFSGPSPIPPPLGFQDNFWQQIQIQDIQRQQQLQAQDQYRRALLSQDLQRQIDQMKSQQIEMEYMQHNLQMHEYSNRLRMYSLPDISKRASDNIKRRRK